jgi:hypothetical protein
VCPFPWGVPKGEKSPTKYWFSTLPADITFRQLVDATKKQAAPAGARASPRAGAAVLMRADAYSLTAASLLIMDGPGRLSARPARP